jgi:alkanesulfonate monooxygenase SsuD/methylene tetrahydromethanopterin reductase-like flavin-dependent oxidoreductase (luciferase family)
MDMGRLHAPMSEHNRPLAVALNGYGLLRPDGLGREVLPLEDLVHSVHAAERGGYEAVFVPEITAREAFSTLTLLATRAEHIRLATGVIRIDRRDLRTTALAAATVQEAARGRFVLGVGSRLPIDSTRTFLTDLRRLLAGETVPGPGGPERLDATSGETPLYLAALGSRMCELAGELADGVILNWCTPERVARAREEIAAGAERSGRDPAAVRVVVYVRTSLEPDEVATASLREVASEYAAMPTYARQLEAMGLGEEAAEAARSPDEVPERLLREVCAWGDRDGALGRLHAYHAAGADVVAVYPVPALDAASSILATVLGVAPSPAAAA